MIALLKLIPTPYLIGAIALILIGTHGLSGYGGWKIRDNSARADAQKLTEAKLLEAQKLNDEIVRLQAQIRAAEAEHQAKIVSISTTLQEQLQNVRKEQDKFVAGVRSGAIRLRIPATTGGPVPSGTAQAGAAACRCDAAPGAELPREVAEFLWGEAGRAEEVVHQLTACQALVLEDRRVCGVKGAK